MRRGGERWGFWFTLAIGILRPLLIVLTRRRRVGLEHIPAEGGFIVAVNHVSYADPLTIAHALVDAGRLPHYLAKGSLFRKPLLRHIMNGCRQIPVERYTSDAAAALEPAVAAVASGLCLVIYPEGTITKDPDGWPMRARTGVARLALMTGAPVLPVAQWGAQRIHSYAGGLHPFCRPEVTTLFGPPVDLSRFAGQEPSAEVLREVTEVIMSAITEQLAEVRDEPAPAHTFDPRAEPEERKSA